MLPTIKPQTTFHAVQLEADDTLPDSTGPYGPCPRCGRTSSFSHWRSDPVSFDGSSEPRDHTQQVTTFQCQGCRDNIVVIEERQEDGRFHGIHWWPTPGMRPIDDTVPPAVADVVGEGMRCLAVRAPRAAVVMFRGALAQIVTDRGSDAAKGKNSLKAQLVQMAADGDLDRTIADWADHIRLIGNAGAHPNELAPVTVEEAEELSKLINYLLVYLYVLPGQVARARARTAASTS